MWLWAFVGIPVAGVFTAGVPVVAGVLHWLSSNVYNWFPYCFSHHRHCVCQCCCWHSWCLWSICCDRYSCWCWRLSCCLLHCFCWHSFWFRGPFSKTRRIQYFVRVLPGTSKKISVVFLMVSASFRAIFLQNLCTVTKSRKRLYLDDRSA